MKRSTHRPTPSPGNFHGARASSAKRQYDHKWRAFRKRFLSLHPFCVYVDPDTGKMCGQSATEADHIIPLSLGGAHCDWDNTQALCKPHHSQKTWRENHPGKPGKPGQFPPAQ